MSCPKLRELYFQLSLCFGRCRKGNVQAYVFIYDDWCVLTQWFDVVSAFVSIQAGEVVGEKVTLLSDWRMLRPEPPTGNETAILCFLVSCQFLNEKEDKQQQV